MMKDIVVGLITVLLVAVCFGLLGYLLSNKNTTTEEEPTVEIKEKCLNGIKHYYSKYYLIRIEDEKGKAIRCEG